MVLPAFIKIGIESIDLFFNGQKGRKLKPSYFTLYQYIAQEFLLSFLICFLFFFFIFFINQLLLMAEQILAKRVPIHYVILLIIYAMPSILALAFPFATLVGALMTFGRFSSDNEIIAFKTSGISQHRIFIPLLVIGVLFSLVAFTINDYYIPLGRVNFTKLYKKLIAMNPEMELESYSIKRYENSTIVIGEVKDKVINNILIIRKDKNSKQIIQAQNARLTDIYKDQGVISLDLDNVMSHTYEYRNRDDYSYTTADNMIYNILINDITNTVSNPGPAEMMSKDVRKVIIEKKRDLNQRKSRHDYSKGIFLYNINTAYQQLEEGLSTPEKAITKIEESYIAYNNFQNKKIEDRNLQSWKLEYFQKFSIPFSCLPFVLLAFPLGLMTRKSGRAVGFGIGLLLTVFYWFSLVLGRTLGLRAHYPPFLTMWIPNIVMFITGSVLYFLRIKK